MKRLEVIELHHKFFENYEFEFHSTQLLYQKKYAHGQQVIFVHFTENPDCIYLEYNLGIRIDVVEQIIHKFLPTLSDYSERSITLVQTPDKIDDRMPPRFRIDNHRQLLESILAAEEFFKTEGFAWLNEMIVPEKIELSFASNAEFGFKTQNFVYNSFRGVTLAKLYNQRDYPILRNRYLEQIKQQEMTPFTIASFFQLLDYLDHLES